MEIKKAEGLSYMIRYPAGYITGEKYPVILFLHGAGSRGDDIELLKNNPFFSAIEFHADFPFVVAAPQCSGNTWFDVFERLQSFARILAEAPFADANRIYLMGASMGGYAAWQLAMSLPELFAAVVPVCGGGMYWNAARLVNVPVWAFHGGKDGVVSREESEKMVRAVNENGGNAKLTIYPENGHDAWSDTYKNPEVFAWLLTNENKNNIKTTDVYKDGTIYG